ncbi:MAG: hypothetical protein Q8P28_02305 [Deltaproteobacteria bacterium]|nr:hypothetical protein [Deltaproteobacteria bacterium]
MGKHLRKLFSAEEVKEIFERYLSQEIEVEQALGLLKIRRRQFFKLLKVYRENPDGFSLDYKRAVPPRKIDAKSDAMIIMELEREAGIIHDKSNPVKFYNYSYLKELLKKRHKVVVSLPTIIARAKKTDFIRQSPFGRLMTVRS